MATTSRVTIERMVSEAIGDVYHDSGEPFFTTSGAGAAGGTTIVCTGLKDIVEADDTLQGWAKIRSGTNIGQSRRIPSSGGFVFDTGTITVNRAYTAQVASAVTFELHRIDPGMKIAAINRAIEQLYPTLYLPIRDETLMVDNILLNAAFQTFSGTTFTNWTSLDGNMTQTQETTKYLRGVQSAKLVASGGVTGIYQPLSTTTPSHQQTEMEGKKAQFGMWAWASAGSTGRVGLSFDGSAYTFSSYHTGSRDWERLTGDVTWDNASTPRLQIQVADGGTIYVDSAWLIVNPIYKYTIPTTIIDGPTHIEWQADENHPEGPYWPLRDYQRPPSGRVLRLQGRGLLTQFGTATTDEADTVEIGGQRLDMLVYQAVANLARAPEVKSLFPQVLDTDWQGMADRLRRQPGIRMTPQSAQLTEGAYTLEADSSGRYILFNRPTGGWSWRG